MFQPTQAEFVDLKSQIATSSLGWGGRRKAPLVLTEHGALQAANVIKSAQANKMSAHIFRTSVLVRKMALINEVFARKVNQLENRVSDHHTLLIELVRKIQR